MDVLNGIEEWNGVRNPFPGQTIGQTILQLIRNSARFPILSISAPTGSGKTVGIPYALRQYFHRTVIVGEPKVAIALQQSRFLQAIYPDMIQGHTLGHYTGMEICPPKRDAFPLIFVTSPLVLTIASQYEKPIIILDEVHAQTDLHVCSMLEDAAAELKANPNAFFALILMSATVDHHQIVQLFEHENVVIHALQLRASSYDTEVSIMKTTDVKGTIVSVMEERHWSRALGFLFGYQLNWLADNIDVIRVSRKTMEQEPDLLEPTNIKRGNKVLYNATQIVELGVTIPDIDVVFDTANTSVNIIAPTYGVRHTIITRASLADTAQRRGRVGRTKPGHYITLLPPEEANESLTAQQQNFPSIEFYASSLEQIFQLYQQTPKKFLATPAAGLYDYLLEQAMRLNFRAIPKEWHEIITQITSAFRCEEFTVYYILYLLTHGINIGVVAALSAYLELFLRNDLKFHKYHQRHAGEYYKASWPGVSDCYFLALQLESEAKEKITAITKLFTLARLQLLYILEPFFVPKQTLNEAATKAIEYNFWTALSFVPITVQKHGMAKLGHNLYIQTSCPEKEYTYAVAAGQRLHMGFLGLREI